MEKPSQKIEHVSRSSWTKCSLFPDPPDFLTRTVGGSSRMSIEFLRSLFGCFLDAQSCLLQDQRVLTKCPDPKHHEGPKKIHQRCWRVINQFVEHTLKMRVFTVVFSTFTRTTNRFQNVWGWFHSLEYQTILDYEPCHCCVADENCWEKALFVQRRKRLQQFVFGTDFNRNDDIVMSNRDLHFFESFRSYVNIELRCDSFRLRPTLAKPTLAILIFRLWPNPTLAKPTLARKTDWPTLIDRLWPNRLWPTLIGRLWPILVF